MIKTGRGKILLIWLILTTLSISTEGLSFPYQKYLSFTAKKVARYLEYPRQALENKWEGIVEVTFFVRKDGSVTDIQITKTSGYPLLDRAAIKAVKKAGPYPFPFLKNTALPVKITISLTFRLLPERDVEHPLTSLITSSKPKKEVLTVNRNKSTSSVTQFLSEFEKKTKTGLSQIKFPTLQTYASTLFAFSNGPEELKQFITTALRNNQPLQIAQQEMELAKLKLKEAKRNLFPRIKIEAYCTEGTTKENLEYREREARINLSQPLYAGGRLTNTIKQSEVNLKLTEKNYEQKKLETIHKTEVAYYNVLALKLNLTEHNKLLTEAEKLLTIVEKQYSHGLIIPLEYNRARSAYQQLILHKQSIEQELKLAKLSLKQVLNTKTIPEVKANALEVKSLNIDLKKCIEVSLKFRPEITLSKLGVKYQGYTKKIEEGKSDFAIDLTTFYGRYEGAYKTEPLKSSDNWYVGVKVTKPLGVNTFATSIVTQHAQPRFGEEGTSKSTSVNAELNVLDNLKLLSDRKRAEIDFLKSQNQLTETEKSIIFEVQDTFFKWQKALLELKSALIQKKFREEEIKVTKTRASVGEATVSDILEGLVRLSQAEDSYTQAVGNYYISLASLKKATGYGISF